MRAGKDTRIWHRALSVLLNCVIGDRCTVHAPAWMGNNVLVGDGCKIQAFAFIPDGVVLEENVFIGPGVVFTNDVYPPSQEWKATTVEKGASIGANATIIAGVTIGAGSLVGAGSVVTKDVAPGMIVAGNPAKVIRKR
jgi:UDP-2-acetamido-3-amino-2,3-dideoxy-glucuronate N-acetyltransferase